MPAVSTNGVRLQGGGCNQTIWFSLSIDLTTLGEIYSSRGFWLDQEIGPGASR
jgi:hypothetical protein